MLNERFLLGRRRRSGAKRFWNWVETSRNVFYHMSLSIIHAARSGR
jgi:hypothetical protein